MDEDEIWQKHYERSSGAGDVLFLDQWGYDIAACFVSILQAAHMWFRRSFTHLIYLAIEKQKNKHHDCPGNESGGRKTKVRREGKSRVEGLKRLSLRPQKPRIEAEVEWARDLCWSQDLLPSPQEVRPRLGISTGLSSLPPLFVLMEGPCLLVIFRCESPSGAMWRHWPATIEQRQPREWAELDNGHFWGQMEKLGEALVVNTESLSVGAEDFSGWKRTG